MIVTVTLNPCVDRTLFVEGLRVHDTNRVTQTEIDAGGKGLNLSRVATRLGAKTVALGFLGGEAGDYVRLRLVQEGVPERCTPIAAQTRTNVSIESGDGPPTTLNEPGPSILPAEFEALRAELTAQAEAGEWVVFAGSVPPSLPRTVIADLARCAHEAGCRVMVDADGEVMQHALGECLDFIKPNRSEAERLLGRSLPEIGDVAAAAQELHQRLVAQGSDLGLVVISLGADGAVMTSPRGTWHGLPIPVEARSTIGSGDSMVAGILTALTSGLSESEALRYGLAAGAATAMTSGSDIGQRADFDALLPQARVQPLS